MKTITRRIFSLLLILVMLLPMTLSVSAATITSKSTSQVALKTTSKTGYQSSSFIVNSGSRIFATKLKYTCTKANFSDNKTTKANIYGYYEIRVWGNDDGNWVELTKYKTNIKNDASGTISMRGYKQYKVQVYSWKTSMIASNRGYSNPAGYMWQNVLGQTYPTITFKLGSQAKSFA